MLCIDATEMGNIELLFHLFFFAFSGVGDECNHSMQRSSALAVRLFYSFSLQYKSLCRDGGEHAELTHILFSISL